jgi:beta-lactamase class A
MFIWPRFIGSRYALASPLVLLALCVPAVAQGTDSGAAQAVAQNDAALKSKLESMTADFHGKLSLYAHDLSTGRIVAIDADQAVPTASVIKLTILYTALEQIRAGKAHFDDRLTLHKDDQVPGSGVLLFFDTPMTLTLKDALTMMIAESDNTATNLVIDHLGLKTIDDQIQALGMKDTWLYKKVYRSAEGPMPADQPQFGLGKTTAREMGGLMERFVNCDLGPAPPAAAGAPGAIPTNKELCDAAMHMLKSQFFRNSIPRYLEKLDTTEGESAVANKAGALDHVRNDVGAVFTKQGTIVISEFTHDNADTSWTPDNEAEVLMAKLAQAIVAAWTGQP